MSFSGFWKAIGLGLVKIGVAVGKSALWASAHPEVITEVTSIVGHPAIGQAVNTGTAAIGAIVDQVQAQSAPPTPPVQ